MGKYIKKFTEIGYGDLQIVGGKCAALGELVQSLGDSSVNVPKGFAITTEGFRCFLAHNNLFDSISAELEQLDFDSIKSLSDAAGRIRASILYGQTPEDLKEEISLAYQELNRADGDYSEVAVRSSATAEDLPHASFAGQQDTYLNIRGTRNLDDAYKKVIASLYSDRAISYRQSHGIDPTEATIAVAIQMMVRSDLASSGVVFTIDTESGFDQVIYITGSHGLGECVVQGLVNPDEYYIFKPALRQDGTFSIVQKKLGSKEQKMIYTERHEAGQSTQLIRTNKLEQSQFVLTSDEIVQLAKSCLIIEDFYQKTLKRKTSVDIEWAKDGLDQKLYIVQARPETVHSQKKTYKHKTYQLLEDGPILVQGRSVGLAIDSGKAKIVLSTEDMNRINPGDILITEITDPDWEPVMKKCAGIVTDRGGRTCHAAIVAREIGVPALVGCVNATEVIQPDTDVTISCAEGATGYIRQGQLRFSVQEHDWQSLEKTKTKVMINLGDPSLAFSLSALPVDGVGLARQEFIISSSIGIHPRAIIDYKTADEYTQYQIDKISAGYDDPYEFYVHKLAEGIATTACAFYPRQVILRLSDFKSNEYRKMIGGEKFEPREENPMLGYRGAHRYFSEGFRDCFELECQAIQKALVGAKLNNLTLMVPFVRTPNEGQRVIDLLKANGLDKSRHPELDVYLMCELPANVILIDEFLDIFDGMSIGSNDLTQMVLGIDRDSSIAKNYDERNPAVLSLIEKTIQACNRRKKYVGICGQAPSDYPELVRQLVQMGIQSLSLNPDSVFSTLKVIAEEEKNL